MTTRNNDARQARVDQIIRSVVAKFAGIDPTYVKRLRSGLMSTTEEILDQTQANVDAFDAPKA